MATEILYEKAVPGGLGYDNLSSEACARFDAEFKRRVQAVFPNAQITDVETEIGPGYWVLDDINQKVIFRFCEDIYADLCEHPSIWT